MEKEKSFSEKKIKKQKKVTAGLIFSKKLKIFFRDNKLKIFFSLITYLICGFLFGLFFTFLINLYNGNNNNNISENKIELKGNTFSYEQKYNKYKQNFTYYKSTATPNELLYSFIETVSDYTYKLGGKWNNKKTDCKGAADLFFRYWGAPFVHESVKRISKRIKTLRQKGALEKRLSVKRVRHGDIIIFIKKKVPSHLAIVYKVTPSGLVQYFDMNLRNKSWGLSVINIHNKKIQGIYEVSLELWMGDFFKKRKK